MGITDKTVPHNTSAEEAVLGAVLIDPSGLFGVSSFLRPDDFYLQKNAWIYESILAINSRGAPVDLLNLSTELENRNQLDAVGGIAYISHLLTVVPSAINIESYGRMVEQTSVRRRLLDAAGQIARYAYEEAQPIEQVVDQSEKVLFGVSQRRSSRDLVPVSEVVPRYYNYIEKLYTQGGELTGVPSGFRSLDHIMGGFQKSDLLILAARPGVGKTSLMLTWALRAAENHKVTAFFNLEMSAEQLVQRLIAQLSGIDMQRLRRGDLSDEDWEAFTQAAEHLSELPLYIDDTPAVTVMQLRTKCRRLASEHGIDMVILDYLQLMGSENRSENRVQEVSYISRSLKGLARELNVPLITGSQLSRALEQRADKRPMLSDLRESGSLEQDADIVMFIYRDELYNEATEKPNIAELIIAKHRNGPTGGVELYFQKKLAQYRDVSMQTPPSDKAGNAQANQAASRPAPVGVDG